MRGRLTWDVTDAVSLDFRGQYGEFKGSSNQYSVVFSGDPNDFVEPQFNIGPFAEGETDELTFKFDADLGFANLIGITGYTKLTETNRADLDFRNPVDSPGGFLGLGIQVGQGQDLDDELLSQEFRLVSADEGRLRWLVGAYYLDTDKKLRTRAFVDLNGDTDQIDNPALVLIDRREANDNKAYAGFGQVDFDLTDALTLTAGARYDRDEREQTDVATGNTRDRSSTRGSPRSRCRTAPTTTRRSTAPSARVSARAASMRPASRTPSSATSTSSTTRSATSRCGSITGSC